MCITHKKNVLAKSCESQLYLKMWTNLEPVECDRFFLISSSLVICTSRLGYVLYTRALCQLHIVAYVVLLQYLTTLTWRPSTISQRTSRASFQLINIEISTVTHFNWIAPITTWRAPVVAYCPRNFSFGNCWVGSVHPTGRVSLAVTFGRAGCRNGSTSRATEAIPLNGDTRITNSTTARIGMIHIPVCICKFSVGAARHICWKLKKN